MNFDLHKSAEILSRTPVVLEALLGGLSEEWIYNNEGEMTWSPFDVVGHLIHGDRTDWIPRMEIILSAGSDRKFEPFDRFAQFEASKGKNIRELLDEFQSLRSNNLRILKSKNLDARDLIKTGIHPEFGEVRLEQLLATWTTHDLSHIAQIARIMARQYTREVGPWKQYLPILSR
jgi:hypothetical protein